MSYAKYLLPGVCPSCGCREHSWTPQRQIDAALAWNEKYGQPPKARDWRNGTPEHPTQATAAKTFGKWNNLLRAAGLPPRPTSPIKWTKDEIGNAMLDWMVRNGRWPTQRDWQKPKEWREHRPTRMTVTMAFGSWRAAKRHAGWLPPAELRAREEKHRARQQRKLEARRAQRANRRGPAPRGVDTPISAAEDVTGQTAGGATTTTERKAA